MRARRLPDELLLVLVALVPRVAYAIAHARTIYFDHHVLDSQWIHQWAIALSRGEGSGADAYFRAPFYPMFVSLLYRVFGASHGPVAGIQHALGAGSTVLLYWLGRRAFGRGAGLAAGIGWAFYWTAIFFEGELHLVALEIVLGLSFLELLSRSLERTGRERLVGCGAAGVALGLAAITRPNFLVLVPLGVLAPFRVAGPNARGVTGGAPVGARALPALVFTLGVLAAVAPVTLRNARVSGDFVLVSSQGGLNFYVGNGAGADGKTAAALSRSEPVSGLEAQAEFRDNVAISGDALARAAIGEGASASEVSRYWVRRTLAELAADVPRAVGLGLRKLYYLNNAFEIGDNRDLAEVQRETQLHLYAPVRLTFVLPLAALGLLFGRWFASPFGIIIVLYTFLYSVSVWLFFVNARLRLPIVPGLMLLAGVGVAEVCRRLRAHEHPRGETSAARWRSLGAPAAVVALTAFVTSSRAFGVDEERNRAAFRFNRGVLLAQRAECEGSLQAFDEAIAIDPSMLEAPYAKARTLEKCGDPARALEAYDYVCRNWPDFPYAFLARGRLREAIGDIERSHADLAAALRLDPDNPDVAQAVGSFWGRQGVPDSAAVYLRQATSLAPGRLSAWIAYAYTLASLNRPAEATEAWSQALRIDPGNAVARRALDALRTGRGRP